MTNKQKIVQKVCTMCEENKPIAQFKRLLTLRQSAFYLKRPTRTRLTVISTRCKDCWHRTKRKTPLTLKEIQRKKLSGDLHTVTADLMTKELRRAIPERRARVMKEYWQKKKQEPLKQLKTNLQQQVAKYCNRFNAYRANINKLENPTPAQHAMLRQHSENYAQAKQIRDSLIKQLQEGKDIDPQILIATLLKPTERSNT
jgi:hypothetical protein